MPGDFEQDILALKKAHRELASSPTKAGAEGLWGFIAPSKSVLTKEQQTSVNGAREELESLLKPTEKSPKTADEFKQKLEHVKTTLEALPKEGKDYYQSTIESLGKIKPPADDQQLEQWKTEAKTLDTRLEKSTKIHAKSTNADLLPFANDEDKELLKKPVASPDAALKLQRQYVETGIEEIRHTLTPKKKEGEIVSVNESKEFNKETKPINKSIDAINKHLSELEKQENTNPIHIERKARGVDYTLNKDITSNLNHFSAMVTEVEKLRDLKTTDKTVESPQLDVLLQKVQGYQDMYAKKLHADIDKADIPDKDKQNLHKDLYKRMNKERVATTTLLEDKELQPIEDARKRALELAEEDKKKRNELYGQQHSQGGNNMGGLGFLLAFFALLTGNTNFFGRGGQESNDTPEKTPTPENPTIKFEDNKLKANGYDVDVSVKQSKEDPNQRIHIVSNKDNTFEVSDREIKVGSALYAKLATDGKLDEKDKAILKSYEEIVRGLDDTLGKNLEKVQEMLTSHKVSSFNANDLLPNAAPKPVKVR